MKLPQRKDIPSVAVARIIEDLETESNVNTWKVAVEQNGRIEQTRDGGATWAEASAGLEAPWPHALIERFAHIGDELLAITNQGAV